MDGRASGVVVNQRAAEGLDRYVVTKHSNSALLLVTPSVSDAVGVQKAQDYMQQQGRPEAVPCGRTDAPEQAGPPLSRPTRRGTDSKGDGISSHPATTEHRNDAGSSSERLVTKTCGPRQPCPFHKHSAVPKKDSPSAALGHLPREPRQSRVRVCLQQHEGN